jgi:hypothetical protein
VANEDQYDGESGVPAAPPASPAPLGARGAARRRFTRAGLGASGVILTLTSQPGMATGMKCSSASGFQSGVAVANSHAAHYCDGLKPRKWKEWPGGWLRTGIGHHAKYGELFHCGGRADKLGEMTCFEVLDPPWSKRGLDGDEVAMHCMAALLNARSGRVTLLPETKVYEIWNQYARTGFFSPRPKVYWSGREITQYLSSTMA